MPDHRDLPMSWSRFKRSAITVGSAAAPLLLITIGILHTVWHERFSLDWQTVSILITGVVFLLVPLKEIMAKLLKLKVGGLELELRKDTEELTKKVTEAETETAGAISLVAPTIDIAPTYSVEELKPSQSAPSQQPLKATERASKPRSLLAVLAGLTALHSEVSQLVAVSPTAGLIKLASTLEQQTINIATKVQPDRRTNPVRSFSIAVQTLLTREQISASLYEALFSFWKLRNKIVHQSAPVGDDVVMKAIDDGFRILRILKDTEAQLLLSDRIPPQDASD